MVDVEVLDIRLDVQQTVDFVRTFQATQVVVLLIILLGCSYDVPYRKGSIYT